MKISASIKNSNETHQAVVSTNDQQTSLDIQPKASGRGSSINGGELLFLALATCYCNDIFREAAEIGMEVGDVTVSVEGEFGGKGDPAKNVFFDVKISADGSEEQIKQLLHHTDSVAEIQNSLRMAIPVSLRDIEIL